MMNITKDIAEFFGLLIVVFIVIVLLNTLEYGEEGWFYKLMMPNEEDNTDKSERSNKEP
jgi:hypothetical protein